MAFRTWALASTIGAIALAVGCSSDSSNVTNADSGGAADLSRAGAPDGDDDRSDSSLAGAPSSGGAKGSANGGAPADGGALGSFAGAPDFTTSPAGLSCMGVLQCAGACPDENVDACVEDCLEQTSVRSQPVTAAFIQCIADNECADATCIQMMCESELGACAADDASAVEGAPSSGPTPTGSVPRELVGLWSQVGLSSGMSYEFSADGSTIQAFSSESNYGCELKTELSSSGVTTVSGDSLVYHRLEGTLVNKTCGTIKSKPVEPVDVAYRYAIGADDDGDPELLLYRVNEDQTLSSPVELHR